LIDGASNELKNVQKLLKPLLLVAFVGAGFDASAFTLSTKVELKFLQSIALYSAPVVEEQICSFIFKIKWDAN